MKIAVMLRHAGTPGGIQTYTRNIVESLLEVDDSNEYFLLFSSTDHLGQYEGRPRVVEKVIRAPSRLLWDQVAVPRFARAQGIDLIFNPKLSVPLFTRCKTVLVMHGAEQFAVPWAFQWYDRLYFEIFNRLYCRFASAIIVMTRTGLHDINRYMGADPEKMRVIYESYNERCRRLDRVETAQVKQKYDLPNQYMLFLGGMHRRKNFRNVLHAFHRVQDRIPHTLVVVGFVRWGGSEELAVVDELGLRDRVRHVGYVDDDEVPAFYNLAELFVFPSFYEGFGMPVLEAMACGCPVIASRTGCSPEVAGGAAALVDPYSHEEIAESMLAVLGDEDTARRMIAAGLERVKSFSWRRCAEETIDWFEALVAGEERASADAARQP